MAATGTYYYGTVFFQYTGSADDFFAPAGAAAYHYCCKVHADGWLCEWRISLFLSTGDVACVVVMAVRVDTVHSVFSQHTGPAGECFAPTGAAVYHWLLLQYLVTRTLITVCEGTQPDRMRLDKNAMASTCRLVSHLARRRRETGLTRRQPATVNSEGYDTQLRSKFALEVEAQLKSEQHSSCTRPRKTSEYCSRPIKRVEY